MNMHVYYILDEIYDDIVFTNNLLLLMQYDMFSTYRAQSPYVKIIETINDTHSQLNKQIFTEPIARL